MFEAKLKDASIFRKVCSKCLILTPQCFLQQPSCALFKPFLVICPFCITLLWPFLPTKWSHFWLLCYTLFIFFAHLYQLHHQIFIWPLCQSQKTKNNTANKKKIVQINKPKFPRLPLSSPIRSSNLYVKLLKKVTLKSLKTVSPFKVLTPPLLH